MADGSSPVRSALQDVPVEGARCLEAGAGVGNTTAALLATGAADVVAVTNERSHATDVRDRFEADSVAVVDNDSTTVAGADRPTVLEADLQATPLRADSVSVVTAHALCNVVPSTDLAAIVAELTRVAEPGAWLVVDDYDPIPHEDLRALFAAENAAAELTAGSPALTFYPAVHLRRLFESAGWHLEWERTLLDPVPWTVDLLDAHAELAREHADALEESVAEALQEEISRRREALGDGVDTGRMYSLAFRLRE